MLDSMAESERRFTVPAQRAQVAARQKARAKACAAWSKAPGVFDDVALALTAAPEAATLTLAWGTAAGTPLGGLKLAPVDDAALDAVALGHDATGVMALYAANLQPFAALKRSGLFATEAAFTEAVEGCDTLAVTLLALRSWPLALSTLVAAPAPASSPLAALKQSLGALRNVVVAVRDFSATGARFAVAGSFEAPARASLESMMAVTGAQGAPTPLGKRTPTVYPLQLPGLSRPAAAALEGLGGGRVGFTVADSEETLGWAFKASGGAGGATAGAGALPLLRLDSDTAAVARRAEEALQPGPDAQALWELLGKLRHIDGRLVSDGDVLRLTLRAPLRP
jgi:hypothetical protein